MSAVQFSFLKKAKSGHQKRHERQEKEKNKMRGNDFVTVTEYFSKKGEHKLEHIIYSAKLFKYPRDY